MKNVHMIRLLGLLLALCFAFVLLGCSKGNVPTAAAYRPELQLQMQAVKHWHEIAAGVAERVKLAREDRPDIRDLPIFIAMPNNKPFTVAFYNFLRTELVSRGFQVSYNREPVNLIMEYTIQTVPFDDSRFSFGPSLGQAAPSMNEVIVNARMFYRNRFILHTSAVRYINDADLALYPDPQAADPMAESSRDIRVVNK